MFWPPPSSVFGDVQHDNGDLFLAREAYVNAKGSRGETALSIGKKRRSNTTIPQLLLELAR